MFGEGPFSRFIGSTLEKDRNEQDRVHQEYPVIKLDCCKECNDELSKGFEVHRDIVVEFFDGKSLGDVARGNVARWLLKTSLLLAHPNTQWDLNASRQFAEKIANVRSSGWSQAFGNPYKWLIEGGEPPGHLSLYVHKVDATAPPIDGASFFNPEVHVGESVIDCSVSLIQVRNVGLTLISHPGWAFAHPFAHSAFVTRAWPTPESMKDLADLEGVSDWPLKTIRGRSVHFPEGAFDAGMRIPLTVETEPLDYMRLGADHVTN